VNEGVVIGVGNPDRGDDGIGPAIARRVGERHPEIDWVVSSGEPAGLIEAWDHVERAVVVDAVVSSAPPGSVIRFDADDGIPESLLRHSTHIMGIGEAVELARALDRLPEHLVVYGVEAGSFAPGGCLTPACAAMVDEVAERIALEFNGAALAQSDGG
jgi:hydrogenase maturation protease